MKAAIAVSAAKVATPEEVKSPGHVKSGRRKPKEERSDASSLHSRMHRILAIPIRFIDNANFARIEDAYVEQLLDECEKASPDWSPRGLRASRKGNAHLARMCEAPLLSRVQERKYFHDMNLLKQRADQARQWMDVESPDPVTIDYIERLIAAAEYARNKLISANMRLVISIVKTFADANTSFDDVLEEGIISLIKSLDSFDFSRGFRFSTYATRAIRRNLYRWLSNRQRDRKRFTPLAAERIEPVDDRDPVRLRLQNWGNLEHSVSEMLSQLDQRERLIVCARFGLGTEDSRQTLQRLARRLGVCKERVRQLEIRALKKLRELAIEMKLHEIAECFA